MPHDQQRYQNSHQHSLEVSNSLEASNSERSYTSRGEAQYQALIHAAYELIAKEGFEGLRTRDVADRAGVNVATLHYYFPHKEDLIRGVVDYIRQQFMERHAPTSTTPPATGLEEFRQELADQEYLLQHAPETYIVLFELGMRSLRDPFIKSIMPMLDAGWRSHIQSYLDEGVQQGLFRADLDIEAASAALIAFLKGCLLQRIINPHAFPAERVHAELEHWLTGHAR